LSLTQILAKKTVFVQALFRIRENTYDADNEPRFSHREVGFCYLAPKLAYLRPKNGYDLSSFYKLSDT
jgi:hypothetical protein